MPTYLGDRLLLIPQSPACLLLRKLEAKVSNIFCRDRKIYGQSEGDPVDLTGGEKAILPAWILRHTKGDLHGLFRALGSLLRGQPETVCSFLGSDHIGRGQEREFQCPGGGSETERT
jgi:hypothetical protein